MEIVSSRVKCRISSCKRKIAGVDDVQSAELSQRPLEASWRCSWHHTLTSEYIGGWLLFERENAKYQRGRISRDVVGAFLEFNTRYEGGKEWARKLWWVAPAFASRQGTPLQQIKRAVPFWDPRPLLVPAYGVKCKFSSVSPCYRRARGGPLRSGSQVFWHVHAL